MEAKEMHYFSDLFDKLLYAFRTSPLSIIRSICIHAIGVCHASSVGCLLAWSLHWKQRTHKYTICCHIAHNNEIFIILTGDFSKEQ